MKFGLFFVNVGPFAEPAPFAALVTGAERCGFESVWTVEHVVVPVGYQATYPYDPSGKIPLPIETALPDPLAPLAYAAALTKTIKLGTGVVILPQRHPFYIAKEAATIDRLSGGRLLLGVGIGWMKDEFDALGIPFTERAGRTDETIRAMRSLWAPAPEAFTSPYFSWGPVEMQPKPVAAGGVSIVIGGHTAAAARRAARYGDGFFPAVGEPEQVKALRAVMAEECARVGRDVDAIEITALLLREDEALLAALAEAGVQRVLIGYGLGGKATPSDIEAWLEGFAARFIIGR